LINENYLINETIYKKPIMTTELAAIIEELKKKMLDGGYSLKTMPKYSSEWKRLLRYAEEREPAVFDSEYCRRFSLDCHGGCYENKYALIQAARPARMLLDFIKFGAIIRLFNKSQKGFSEGYTALFEEFLTKEKNRGLSKVSLAALKSSLYRLEQFLLDIGITQFYDVEASHINNYIEVLAELCSTTISEHLRQLRRLSDYAYEKGFHTRTFSNIIPHTKNLCRQRIPHIFTPDEAKRLLAAVDRENPVGKRDYAMLIIAVRLGLRVSDIRSLEFSALDWDKKTVSLVQSKTGRFLELALPEDVGWAIIDYMKHGRPKCESKTVFVNHIYPFRNLSGASINLVAKYMRSAGIYSPNNRKVGMHTLRHSLASEMLAQGVSIEDISGVLGHADIHSSETYIRIDIQKLRKCALEVDI